jgi:hypothetical protein
MLFKAVVWKKDESALFSGLISSCNLAQNWNTLTVSMHDQQKSGVCSGTEITALDTLCRKPVCHWVPDLLQGIMFVPKCSWRVRSMSAAGPFPRAWHSEVFVQGWFCWGCCEALWYFSYRNIYIYIYLFKIYFLVLGVRGNAVDWGTALQAGRSWVRFPMV